MHQRIKLLHVVARFGVGGSERQQTELIKRLPSERYQQVVATMEKNGPFLEEIDAGGIDVVEFPFTSFYNRNALRQYRALARLIRQRGIELVHCHDFYANIFGTISARLAGLRKLVTSRRNLGVRFSFMQRLMQRAAYSFSAAVLANSDAAKEVLMKKEHVPEHKIRRVYNGIDTERFSPCERSPEPAASLGLPADAAVVGIIGSLWPWKDHKTFLQAAAEIHKCRPDVRFLIAGDGPMRAELEQLARDLGLGGATVFAGSRTDVPRLLAMMDVFVLTSQAESLPNAVLEAMACALPVVATSVGGVPEVVVDGETGHLVPPRAPALLAEKVLRILGDSDVAAGMGAAARQSAVDRFSCRRLVENMGALYASVLEKK